MGGSMPGNNMQFEVRPEEPIVRYEPGSLLDDYVLGEHLGAGCFGTVLACVLRNSDDKTCFAVKMVDKAASPVPAIEHEIATMKALTHPNIMSVRKVYDEKDLICIVMPRFSGGDLISGMTRHWESLGLIPPAGVVHVQRQMAESLAYLHGQRVVHRDVKGDNFVMDRKDISDTGCLVVLSDFGTACTISDGQRLSECVGTSKYWPPEVWAHDYSFKSDVWALGVIVYGLVHGNFPFSSCDSVRDDDVSFPISVPAKCIHFIQELLTKQEERRPSAKEALGHDWLTMKGPAERVDSEVKHALGVDQPGFSPALKEDGAASARVERRAELLERLEDAAEARATRTHSASIGSLSRASRRRCDFRKDRFEVKDSRRRRRMVMESWTVEKAKQNGMPADFLEEHDTDEGASSSAPGADSEAADEEFYTSEATAASQLSFGVGSGRLSRASYVSDSIPTVVSSPPRSFRLKTLVPRNPPSDPNSVQRILEQFGIDASRFGHSGAKPLECFACEVYAGNSRLMLDASEHKMLLRVVDVVVLRLWHEGTDGERRYLIQAAEIMPDGQQLPVKNRLPATKKQPHENTRKCAERIVSDILNMSECMVNLDISNREIFDAEEDSISYPGVRTIYRKEIVEGAVQLSDEALFGSPGNANIAEHSWEFEDDYYHTRFFDWKSKGWCHSEGVALHGPARPNAISALVPAPPGEFTVDFLRGYLEEQGVDTQKFGEGNAKSLYEFADELCNCESALAVDTETGEVVRSVNFVLLRLSCAAKGGAILVVTEQSEGGTPAEIKNTFPSTRRLPNEHTLLAAKRVITKKLSMDENAIDLQPGWRTVESRESIDRYPGIQTLIRKHIVTGEVLEGTAWRFGLCT